MMTPYEQGFMVKCAEYDLPYGVATSLLKIAQSPDPLSYGSSEDPFAGSEAAAPTPQPAFQPNAQQQMLQASWDKMTADGQARNLSRIGITQQQFDGYTPQQRYAAMDKMRNAWMQEKQKAQTQQQQQPRPTPTPRPTVQTQRPQQARQPKPTDMVSYKGSMIPRADYDRIMANKSKELTPQQIAQNRANAVGRGWQIQHQQQEARYAATRGRQPRGPNGQLQTINLAGRPTSPYSSRSGVAGIQPATNPYASRSGVRGIPRPAGT